MHDQFGKGLDLNPTLLRMSACSWVDYLHEVKEYEIEDSGITVRMVTILWAP